MDTNIEDLVEYLNSQGCETTNSCGHEGTVDVDKIQACRKAMKKLKLSGRSYRFVDYSKGDPPGMKGKPRWVLQILGARPYTKEMWKVVQRVSDTTSRRVSNAKYL